MSIPFSTAVTETRRLTRTSTASFTDADVTTLSNNTYLEIQRTMALQGIKSFGKIQQATLVVGQQLYQFPTDLLAINRIEVNYVNPADPNNNYWNKMTEIDVANLPAEWYQLLNSTPMTKPLYDSFGGFFYPMPPATTSDTNPINGLRIWFIQAQTPFALLTDPIPVPLDARWELIPKGNAMRYFQPLDQGDYEKFKGMYDSEMEQLTAQLKDDNKAPIRTVQTDYTLYGYA